MAYHEQTTGNTKQSMKRGICASIVECRHREFIDHTRIKLFDRLAKNVSRGVPKHLQTLRLRGVDPRKANIICQGTLQRARIGEGSISYKAELDDSN